MHRLFSMPCATAARGAVLSLAMAHAYAQGTSYDECATALQLSLGGRFSVTTFTASPSPVTWPGGFGLPDVWLRYTAEQSGSILLTGCDLGPAAATEVFSGDCSALTRVATTIGYCGAYWPGITHRWTATAGTTYYIRVTHPTGSSWGFLGGVVSFDPGFELRGVSESTPGGGTLTTFGGSFQDLDWLRWNYAGSLSRFGGNFAATVLNIGNGGAALTGMTPLIPGFEQIWSGSSPSGTALVFGPHSVFAADESVQIPTGLFSAGDTVRIQALVLDAASTTSSLPALPSGNTVEWVFGLTCAHSEGFESVPAGMGSLPAGWASAAAGTWSTVSTGAPTGSQMLIADTGVDPYNRVPFVLRSPVYPAAGLSVLEFQLGRLGPACRYFSVSLISGGSARLLAGYPGVPPRGATNPSWTLQRLPLTNLGSTVQIEFQYLSHGDRGDIGIDEFCLR